MHGSVAFQCFNWAISDIDYIVVVNVPLSLEQKLKLMEKTVYLNTKAPSKGIEMSVVLKGDCLDFSYPTPYLLHFSKIHLDLYHSSPLEYCNKMCGCDPDLAAHFTVIKNNGLVLLGEPIDAVFGPVARSYYLHSIREDIKNAAQDVFDHPVYTILNLCRVAAYIEDSLILSKSDGGKWALRNTPGNYHKVIENALASYESAKQHPINKDDAVCFCEYMIGSVL